MSSTNLYGPIVTMNQVEQAVNASLGQWLDGALGEIERIDGWEPNQIERPHAYMTQGQFDKREEIQTPCILTICAGMAGKPERHAEGMHNASWLVGCAAVVSDVDTEATRKLANSYAAAIRVAILQHKNLASPAFPDGFATYIDWHDETYADMPFDHTRSLGAARSVFEVGVESVVTEYAGPRTPQSDPTVSPPPLPFPAEINVTEELVESLP